MRDAGMVRLAREDRLQDRRAFELIGVGLVGRARPTLSDERVVDLRFVVVRIALRQLFHRLRIIQDAGTMIDLVIIDVHRASASM